MFYLRFLIRKGVPRDEVPHIQREQYIDREAVVDSVISQNREWKIRYQGIFWKARSLKSDTFFVPGDLVVVTGRKGLTLFMIPLPHD